MASDGSDHGRYPIVHLLALSLAGLAGNYFNIPLFPNLEVLFGSTFSMLALQLLGLWSGVAVALTAGSYTLLLWQHPYALLILVLETLVVGWLVLRRQMGMLLADTVFWLTLGMPLAYLCYHHGMHFPSPEATLVFMKLALNGLANVLLARLLFTAYAIGTRRISVSFRDIIYELLASFVLFPSLIVLVLSGRADFRASAATIQETLRRDAHRVSLNLDHWLKVRKETLSHLARLAATLPPEEMQARLDQARLSDYSFQRIGLLNREAVTTAYSPVSDPFGQSNLGKSFADRPFLPQLRQRKEPMLSELVRGTIDSSTPRVLILAPVLVQGEYAGHLAGVLNLDRAHQILDQALDSPQIRYTLLDRHGMVIVSNRGDQEVMSRFERGPGNLTPLGNQLAWWVPKVPGTVPAWQRWKRSAYTVEIPVGSFSEWRLILEQPLLPSLSELLARYAGKFALILAIFLAALVLAELLSRLFHSRFLELTRLTADLPARLAEGQQISWPDRPVLEVRQLMGNFQQVTASLTAQIQQTRALNETLEQRVSERTAELSELNRDFVNFLENTSDFVYYKDRDSRYRFCSQAVAVSTGHARWRDLVGKHDSELFPAELARIYLDEEAQIFRDGVSLFNKINPTCDPQGKRRWISTNKWPVFDAAGQIVGIFGISRDITERIEIEESLRLAQQSLNQVPDPIMWADPCGRIVDCNAGACQMLGYDQYELLDSTIFEIDQSTTRENWPLLFSELRTLRNRHYESSYCTRDGRSIPVDVQLAYISFGDKEFLCGVARDLSDRKAMEEERLRLERQALHVQKLESLGVLSGGIAHDFNNLLQVVLGNLDLGLMALPEDARVRRNLEQAVIATVRASELSGMMLAYSGKGVLSVKRLDLSELIRENGPMLTAVVSRGITFTSALAPDLPPVQADATQVLQVVLNLVRNASEAIGSGGGTITLGTGSQEFDRESLAASRIEEKLPAGPYVWIEVRDNGCGMDEATQYRSFDPFFTTKFTGRGLGMSAALGIMRAHKGAIMLESTPGVGTAMRLLFPIAPQPYPVRRESTGNKDPLTESADRRPLTALVVDDEEMVRTLSESMLQAFGFLTLSASDGEAALEIFRRERQRIDLVLLDQNMPTMDGLSVFKELRQLSPEVKVLLASGYSQKEVAARFQGLDLNGFIQKPFNVRHLRDEIQRVLWREVTG
ncbi:hypothetical protein GMST_18360 [Geomonas silvestris]|uniref:histidine kinase n=1 Tax=Geomonas silvestris TaxID=2740184 RepID=A0A6V8MHN5_9BACT|nr:PAS domain S-box protein [Geomonas silvestris]GFO59511.1 hypothetical protein GMST_18360 [Geomonas silvestris]